MGESKKKTYEALSAKHVREFVEPYRVADPKGFHLRSFGTGAPSHISKGAAQKIAESNRERLRDLQERLYAQDQWAVLVILQGMDAAGKDSVIDHVMSGVNPQGCQVYSFKAPSVEELDHDFLWRCAQRVPERGRIGIFNRSYYEECLVVRVHPEMLKRERIPPRLVTGNVWRERFEDIANFERYLSRNGIVILKFFLTVSKQEQRERFLERLDIPAKRWKFSMSDVAERKLWPKYMAAYQDMIRHTSSAHAPWHVVPADNKWFTRAVIGSAIVNALEGLKLQFPKVDPASLSEFAAVRAALEAGEGDLGPPADKRRQK